MILADPHCTDGNADNDLILIPPEPFPDLASPENFGDPEQVSVYTTKQFKPANNQEDVCHILSYQMKSSARQLCTQAL